MLNRIRHYCGQMLLAGYGIADSQIVRLDGGPVAGTSVEELRRIARQNGLALP